MSEQTPQGLAPVDVERIRASLDQLYDIFKDIAVKADEVSTRRCPYKNMRDRCTAQFGCRNQRRAGAPEDLPKCAGDDKLDYRGAWES